MSDCTGGESNAVVRKRNGKRRFRRVRGVKSANIRRIQKPNLHFGLRGIICAAAALFIGFAKRCTLWYNLNGKICEMYL